MTILDLRSLVGLSESEAEASISRHGLISRITSKNGEVFMVTFDYLGNRVNLDIEDDKVVGARIG